MGVDDQAHQVGEQVDGVRGVTPQQMVRTAGTVTSMPFVDVRDLSVYYELHGTGPRVVWINGTGGDLRQNPARGTGPLEQHFEVLMYDQRGLGRTSKPDAPCTMADYADDAAALMDALGWERAHVLGVSFGGMVAQHLALRHPEHVDRLILACTSSGGAGGSSYDLLSLESLPDDERLRTVLRVFDSRNDPDADPPVLAPVFDWLAPMMAGPPLNADDPDARWGHCANSRHAPITTCGIGSTRSLRLRT